MQPGDLPQFDAKETYWLSGETLNMIINYIKEKTVVVVPGSGLKIDEVGPDGTKVSVNPQDIAGVKGQLINFDTSLFTVTYSGNFTNVTLKTTTC